MRLLNDRQSGQVLGFPDYAFVAACFAARSVFTGPSWRIILNLGSEAGETHIYYRRDCNVVGVAGIPGISCRTVCSLVSLAAGDATSFDVIKIRAGGLRFK